MKKTKAQKRRQPAKPRASLDRGLARMDDGQKLKSLWGLVPFPKDTIFGQTAWYWWHQRAGRLDAQEADTAQHMLQMIATTAMKQWRPEDLEDLAAWMRKLQKQFENQHQNATTVRNQIRSKMVWEKATTGRVNLHKQAREMKRLTGGDPDPNRITLGRIKKQLWGGGNK